MSSHTIESIVEILSGMNVLDMAKLKTALEEKWGVKAASGAPVMMAAQADAAAPAAESTDFQIILGETPADKKIAIIKIVREITGLGLKEAKDMVDAAPKAVKETAPKAEAEEIKKKIEAAGGKVTLKGL